MYRQTRKLHARNRYVTHAHSLVLSPFSLLCMRNCHFARSITRSFFQIGAPPANRLFYIRDKRSLSVHSRVRFARPSKFFARFYERKISDPRKAGRYTTTVGFYFFSYSEQACTAGIGIVRVERWLRRVELLEFSLRAIAYANARRGRRVGRGHDRSTLGVEWGNDVNCTIVEG